MKSAALLSAAAAAVVLLALARWRGDLLAEVAGDAPPVDLGPDGAEAGQGGAAFDMAAFVAGLDLPAWPTPADDDQAARNVAAFLMAIRRAEGTADRAGYRRLFGGALFTDMTDHPRRAQQFRTRAGEWQYTTAAGAFQFMARSRLPSGGFTRVDTWDRIAAKLGLIDFSPDSQDAAAVELIREAGALATVQAGEFDRAMSQVRRIWASLPGAGYSQPETTLNALRQAYAEAGGAFA